MGLILLVGTGGFLGSTLRFLIGLSLKSFHFLNFPIATLCVNLLGSFLIGICLALGETRLGQNWFHFLVPGLLGGFTTYSAFSGEILSILRGEYYSSAVAYILFTLIGGVIFAFLGLSLGQKILS